MAPVTRGGLNPATLTNLVTNEVVNFMFNPFEYSIKKSNSWTPNSVVGLNLPKLQFHEGQAQTLSLTLHFDSQARGTDVREYSAPLWTMMMIDTNRRNSESGKSEPPPVKFKWNRLEFKAVITSMTEKITLFSDAGVPLRSSVDVSLQQYIDNSDIPPQIAQQGSGQAAPTTATVVQGDRPDNIAAQNGGNPANYRQIAADNNIDNPLNVPPGTNLRVR